MIELVIKSLLHNKRSRSKWLTNKLYQTLTEELLPIIHKLSTPLAKRGNTSQLILWVSITPIPKAGKGTARKESQKLISLMHRHKKPSTKYRQAEHSNIHNGLYTMTKWKLTQNMQGGCNIRISIKYTVSTEWRFKKIYAHLNRHRKSIRQNPMLFHDKSAQTTDGISSIC